MRPALFNNTYNIPLPFTFSIFDVLILTGITQGFVITGLIWSGKKKTVSKLLLSFLLVTFNLLCIKILIHTIGLWEKPGLRYFPLAVELAISPLIWLYVSSLVTTGFKLKRKHLLHFLPFVISLAYSLFIYINVLPEKELMAKDALANSFYFNTVNAVVDYLSILAAGV